MKHLFTFMLSFFIVTSASAEVYRWTDADGKTHYSDKKPAEKKAENISAEIKKKQNIDTSHQEHEKLEALFRKENEADREYQKRLAQPSPEKQHMCTEAKDYLQKIEGRVQFLDDDGKPVNVTEQERKERAAKMRAFVKENCSD